MEKGLRIPWKDKKNEVVWRGSVGCQVGCGKRGDLYFPFNHINHCKDDFTFRKRKGKRTGKNRMSQRSTASINPNRIGRTSGCEMSSVGKYHPRIQLVNISLQNPSCVNARFTSLNGHDSVFSTYFERPTRFMGSGLTEDELIMYRFVVNVQNNGFADRLWRLLSLGLVVFQESHVFREFYYEMLTPWIHFIPIQTDLSDLCEKVMWAKNNEEKSKQIAENARSFIRDKLGVRDIDLYVAKLIYRTGELVSQGNTLDKQY